MSPEPLSSNNYDHGKTLVTCCSLITIVKPLESLSHWGWQPFTTLTSNMAAALTQTLDRNPLVVVHVAEIVAMDLVIAISRPPARQLKKHPSVGENQSMEFSAPISIVIKFTVSTLFLVQPTRSELAQLLEYFKTLGNIKCYIIAFIYFILRILLFFKYIIYL
ncbi:hypothetical protein HanRHA438_Chr11g0531141 [Helianthus annuus]|nr:hypothetical protein HanRHA438_Chr11g0531141 [Helianthus annuus]